MNGGRRLRAVGAIVTMTLLIVGVPALLIALVGNPWPGRARLELGDEVALVVGVLAVLAWLVWLRFIAVVVVEVRDQVSELRRAPTATFAPPPPARHGVGFLAQRLVAAALIILPIAPRATTAVAHGPDPEGQRAAATLVVSATSPGAPGPLSIADVGGHVTVLAGDTLFGLARTHLGDAERWREIFELNRDRPQPDGGRLTSPSIIRAGWTLALPAGVDVAATAAAPYVASGTITIDAGDNLWSLSHDRLEQAGAAHDDGAVAEYLQSVVAMNQDVVEDPDLIYVGEQFDFPAIGMPPPAPPPPLPLPPPPPAAVEVDAAYANELAPPAPTATASSTSVPAAPPVAPPATAPTERPAGAPSPVGVGEAALLSAGVLALLASRRRARLRASRPRARVPEPPAGSVAAERRLRTVDAGERLARVDVAVRGAAAVLVDTTSRVVLVRAATDGLVELTLSGDTVLPAPWQGAGRTWSLPGHSPIELLADLARTVGAPCVALTQLGVDPDGGELLADLEAIGVLGIAAPASLADAVVRGVAATLATSVFAEPASLVGVGIDQEAFLDHPHAHVVDSVDGALELAATLVGTTAAASQSTFVLRARHTSGEAWEPAIVLVGSSAAGELDADVVRSASRCRGGVAVVAAGDAPGAPWSLRMDERRWTLEPAGLVLTPVGLSTGEIAELHDVLSEAAAPLVADEPEPAITDVTDAAGVAVEPEMPWTLMVRLIGQVEVVDAAGGAAVFERSKALELIAWLTLHRDRSTRAGARTALWELDVRDATFANVVSEARRSMARLSRPPNGGEWLGRTLTEILPLHALVVSDVDVVRRRLDIARVQPPEQAIATLRPAVELIRDIPFASTGYLWPDAEGITSNLVLLATSAATELAAHFLSMGDIGGVFWATGQGLKVLPGHEELIALRMRAHARAGDLSGVRQEWESYERVLDADPWGDGEPAPKLVVLRRELLSS